MNQIKIKTTKAILVISIENTGQISDFNKDVDRLYNYLYNKGFKDKITGPLIGLFYSESGGRYIVAVPIKEKIPVEKNMKIMILPKIRCVYTFHKGTYKTIEEAFNRLKEYLDEKHWKLNFPVREIYINSSGEEEDYLTEIQIPIKRH